MKPASTTKTELEYMLQGLKYPILGLGYIIELSRNSSERIYKCVLCGRNFNPEEIVPHLRGRTHKVNYMEVHFRREFLKMKAIESQAEQDKFLLEWVEKVQIHLDAQVPLSAALPSSFTRPTESPQNSLENEKNQKLLAQSYMKHISERFKFQEDPKEQDVLNTADLETVHAAINAMTEMVMNFHLRHLPSHFKEATLKMVLSSPQSRIEDQIKEAKASYVNLLKRHYLEEEEPISSLLPSSSNTTLPIDLTEEEDDDDDVQIVLVNSPPSKSSKAMKTPEKNISNKFKESESSREQSHSPRPLSPFSIFLNIDLMEEHDGCKKDASPKYPEEVKSFNEWNMKRENIRQKKERTKGKRDTIEVKKDKDKSYLKKEKMEKDKTEMNKDKSYMKKDKTEVTKYKTEVQKEMKKDKQEVKKEKSEIKRDESEVNKTPQKTFFSPEYLSQLKNVPTIDLTQENETKMEVVEGENSSKSPKETKIFHKRDLDVGVKDEPPKKKSGSTLLLPPFSNSLNNNFKQDINGKMKIIENVAEEMNILEKMTRMKSDGDQHLSRKKLKPIKFKVKNLTLKIQNPTVLKVFEDNN